MKRQWWDAFKTRARSLKRETLALYFAYRDPRSPWYARLFVALVVAYAFSPIDLIPDFIPVLGYLDDLILLPLGVYLALKMIPAEVMADARLKSESLDSQPVQWVAAGFVIALWLLGLLAVIQVIRLAASG